MWMRPTTVITLGKIKRAWALSPHASGYKVISIWVHKCSLPSWCSIVQLGACLRGAPFSEDSTGERKSRAFVTSVV